MDCKGDEDMKTFTNMYKELNVKRTTLLLWVHNILGIKKQPSSCNDVIYLSDEEVMKLWQVRLFKQIDNNVSANKQTRYSNDKIKKIINDPTVNRLEILDKQINELKQQREELDKLINIAVLLRDTGMSPASFRFGFYSHKQIDYGIAADIVGKIAEIYSSNDASYNDYVINEKEILDLQGNINTVFELRQKGYEPSANEIQSEIKRIFETDIAGEVSITTKE